MTDVRRLPPPVTAIWEWQLGAACRELPNSMFFHPEGERGRARSNRERIAKQVCAQCPVRTSCRQHALTAREPYGVWGGLGEQERAALLAGLTA